MIYLYGQLFENIENERNIFERKSNSPEYEKFYNDTLKIVKNIIKKKLNVNQKKLLLLFLEGKSKYEISKILGINNSTVHQNYNLIIKKISISLIEDEEFMKILNGVPEYLKNNLLDQIDEIKEKYEIKEYHCPVCNKKFKNKYNIKKHIFKINDKQHIKYYKKQLKFINKSLKNHGFNVQWIYENKNLLFSLSWIYNYWRKNYAEKGSKNFIQRIFKKFNK